MGHEVVIGILLERHNMLNPDSRMTGYQFRIGCCESNPLRLSVEGIRIKSSSLSLVVWQRMKMKRIDFMYEEKKALKYLEACW
jgi:hypothetical protein